MKSVSNRVKKPSFRLAVPTEPNTKMVARLGLGSALHEDVHAALESYRSDPESQASQEVTLFFSLMSSEFLGLKKG